MTYVVTVPKPLDRICWEVFGHTKGVVEETYLLNPGLADLGMCLPTGTEIILPEISTDNTSELVRIWS